jgi:hypothetical protein
MEQTRRERMIESNVADYPFCQKHKNQDYGIIGEWCIKCAFDQANERIRELEKAINDMTPKLKRNDPDDVCAQMVIDTLIKDKP